VSGESSVDLEIKLNTALNIIEHLMNINKLKMNARKTKYMIEVFEKNLEVILL